MEKVKIALTSRSLGAEHDVHLSYGFCFAAKQLRQKSKVPYLTLKAKKSDHYAFCYFH